MSIRMDRLAILILVGFASCSSESRRASDSSAVVGKASPAGFLNVSLNSYVFMTQLTDQDGRYVLVYSEDRSRGVVFDVETAAKTGLSEVLNVGYGRQDGDGQWSLWNV